MGVRGGMCPVLETLVGLGVGLSKFGEPRVGLVVSLY